MLEAREVSFGYEPGVHVLSSWTAAFAAGEVVAITGPSGKGKSTLLYILGLMLTPEKGRVLIDGRDVIGLTDRERAHLRAQMFGFVFQDAALDPTRTVIDNVIETALFRREPREMAKYRAHELMDQFDVALRANAKPAQVSGGQAQRIALCRALLNNPRILLADEPTGNLDPVASDVVVAALRAQAASGAVVVVVTHDPELASQCDRIVAL